MLPPLTMKPMLSRIDQLLAERVNADDPVPAIIGIDGKCGAGKTTLAAYLCTLYDADIIHMDDFFLPLSLRTEARLEEPGGNIHYERLLEEIAIPLLNSAPAFSYRRFDCSRMDYTDSRKVVIHPGRLLILEGSYSMHPELTDLYALRIFADITESLQAERILARNGADALPVFLNRWIPMENYFFTYYRIPESCDYILNLQDLPQLPEYMY